MAGDLGAGRVLAQKFGTTFDWSDPIHWDDDVLEPCRLCKTPTHSRDAQRRPIHQSCAEELATEQAGRRAGALVGERFSTPAHGLVQHTQTTEVTR